jgi:hypothetical protein
MEQPSSGTVGFREVDREGKPVSPEPKAAEGAAWTSRSWPAVNPFIVALWLLALALIAGGVSVFLNSAMVAGPMGGGMPLSFLIFTLAPYAVFGGLVTIVCLLFWHALQWQRRLG